MIALPSWGGAAQSATEQPVKQPLLSQFVNIDRGDFQAKGKIALYRLQPLAGQLTLEHAHGNPEWIFKTIAPWNPSLSNILKSIDIKELTLNDGDVSLDGKQVDLRWQKATIPEGWIEGLIFQQQELGGWNLKTAKMRLERLPVAVKSWLVLAGEVGFERLEAAGDRTKGSGWAEGVYGPGWSVGRLIGSGEVQAWNKKGHISQSAFSWTASQVVSPALKLLAARIPALGELLRFAGKDPKKQESYPLDQLQMQVESDGGDTIRIKQVRLESPWLKADGEGRIVLKGKRDTWKVMLNQLAKTPGGKEKRFKIHFSFADLVVP